jgi:hypothetical protein
LTVFYNSSNYKCCGIPIVISEPGNHFFLVHFIYSFHRINLSSLVFAEGMLNLLRTISYLCRRRWLSGTILISLVLDSTGFWVRISARTPILRNITTGGDITGGFCPGAGFPSCHKSIYRVSEDNFRGSACVSEWMLISVKDGGLVFHNLRLHKDNKLE